jgi:hypothetical protein
VRFEVLTAVTMDIAVFRAARVHGTHATSKITVTFKVYFESY